MTSIDIPTALKGSGTSLTRHDDALRQLFFLSLDPSIELDDKISRLLELGCDVLGLPLGIVSRINGTDYEVQYTAGPDWAPEPGSSFDVSRTYCIHTLAAEGVRHFHHAGQSEIASHPCYIGFGLESYIGVPLRVGAESVGTLNFSGRDTRTPFTSMEIELVGLFGRWLGQEWLKWGTARKLAEQTMLLNSVIEAVPDAIIATDSDQQIQMVNAATERLFGFSRNELIGRNGSILYASLDEYEQQGERIFRKAIKEPIDRFEMGLRKRDGSTFDGEVFIAPLRNEANNRLGLVGVARDISDRKALDQARDELIATVSHELRTPITSVMGALKLLAIERGNLSAGMQKMLDTALRNTERLTQLVEDILDFEKYTSKDTFNDMHKVSLFDVLQRAIEEIRPYAAEHNVRVTAIDSEAAGGWIQGDENRLLQVMSNLLSNAVKASPPGSFVEAGTTADGFGFWVRDYGNGIPVTIRKTLFDRFTRAPGSYAEGQSGTGLGMSIVKTIVDRFGGEIQMESSEGEGTTFNISFAPASADRIK
ncbi:ATP-binding protein [Litoreibacter janthinus]|uniref:histidine kinase n=1 Tax=Litoreibacter janthinus TaxID=670154 RepID=A0A1I6FS18_9RHOB|nr:ATP-binding protein [Litoreibacter janthinus]SFR32688.1 PAS domain S-box-containing protein [Litoreibacter janthinus]